MKTMNWRVLWSSGLLCSVVWWNAARLYGVVSKDWNMELGRNVLNRLYILCPYKSV